MRTGLCLALFVCLTLVSRSQAWWSRRSSSRFASASSGGRPSFSSLRNEYPWESAWSLKESMDLPDWLFANGTPDTCAIRMSKAFHDAGLGIDRSRVGSCSTSSANVDGTDGEYIIRALFFRCYLRAIWGSPDRTGISSSSDIRGDQGVLIFACGRLRHIDLWNGYICATVCPESFFERCSSGTVELYELE